MNILSKLAIILFCLGILTDIFAQNDNDTKRKEVTVESSIKDGVKSTTVQINANGKIQSYDWEGDEIPTDIKQALDDLEIDIELEDPEMGEELETKYEVHQSIEKKIEQEKQIRITVKDGKEEKTIEWNGDGEMPEEIKKEIEDIDMRHGHSDKNKVIIKSDDGTEKVFEWVGEDMPAEVRESLSNIEENHNIDVHVKKGQTNKGFLGIAIAQTIEESVHNSETQINQTLSIDRVIPGSAAEKAKLTEGDELLEINGEKLLNAEHIIEILNPFVPGDEITVTINRSGQRKDIKVTLTEPLENPEMSEKIIIEKKVIEEIPSTHQVIKQDGLLQLQELKVHPNPTDGKLSISFKSRPVNTKVSVTDLSGKTLYERTIEDFNGTFNEEVDLQKMPKGALIIKIEQGGKITTEKIMHQ